MRQPELNAALRDLAAKVAAIEPPGSLEADVMAEFDRAHNSRPVRMRPMRLAGFGGEGSADGTNCEERIILDGLIELLL